MKNAMAILFVSQGIPMILMGDEVGRTQEGNNNTYCQDNDLSWLDWNLLEENQDLHRFCKEMMAFRKAHPALRHPHFAGTQPGPEGTLEITWHGTRAWQADWSGTSRVIAFQSRLQRQDQVDQIYVAMNMDWEALPFGPPELTDGRTWHLFANTGVESPHEICTPGEEEPINTSQPMTVGGRSVVILVAR